MDQYIGFSITCHCIALLLVQPAFAVPITNFSSYHNDIGTHQHQSTVALDVTTEYSHYSLTNQQEILEDSYGAVATNLSVNSRQKKQVLPALMSMGTRILESISGGDLAGFLGNIKGLFGDSTRTFLKRNGHGEKDLDNSSQLVSLMNTFISGQIREELETENSNLVVMKHNAFTRTKAMQNIEKGLDLETQSVKDVGKEVVEVRKLLE
ncbi:unnamed protein product, partial [Allacma fusca]